MEIYTVQAFTIDIVFVGIKKSSRNHKMTSLGFITLMGRWYFLRKFSHPHTYAGNYCFLNYWYQKFLNFELQILIIMIIKIMIILSSNN